MSAINDGNTDITSISRGGNDFFDKMLAYKFMGGNDDSCDTRHEISEAAHKIQDNIFDLSKNMSSGFYALNDTLKDLAYNQQALSKDTQTLIVSKFAEQESKAQDRKIAEQGEEINRYKTIAALTACNSGNE